MLEYMQVQLLLHILGGGGVTWSSHDRCSGCLIRPGRPGRIRAQGSLQGASPEKQATPQGLRFHQVRVAGAILFSVAAVPTVRGESHRSLHGCQAETNSSQNPMNSTETSYSQKGGKRGSHGLLSGRITFRGFAFSPAAPACILQGVFTRTSPACFWSLP